jgi:hypothetical protein
MVKAFKERDGSQSTMMRVLDNLQQEQSKVWEAILKDRRQTIHDVFDIVKLLVQRLSYRSGDQQVGVRFPGGETDFSLVYNVQIICGFDPASYKMATGVWSSMGVKVPSHLHLMLRLGMAEV